MGHAVEFNNVWKKFRKGEKFNSLRDSIPNLFRKKSKKVVDETGLTGKEFWAVKNTSFQVNHGEVVGIMGPNGAGKSTILKLLSKIMLPNKGSMVINGRLAALIEVTAGFHPELTGRENVYLNGTILGMKKKEIDNRFDEIVDFSGVGDFIDTPVKRYSSGMFSRLGFSVASHMDSEILLVDEVLSVGDIAFQAKCAEKMRGLLKSGSTIIIVSHSLALIKSLCQRVILLQEGEVVKDGPVDEVIPLYQNIVFQNREAELKSKLEKEFGKVSVDKSRDVEIEHVRICNERGEEKEDFSIDEEITVKVDYFAKSKVKNPVFVVDIGRADGITCVSSTTKDSGVKVDFVEGRGTVTVKLGNPRLVQGIYIVDSSIWDHDFIHPYAVNHKDVFRIDMQDHGSLNDGIFRLPVEWEIK